MVIPKDDITKFILTMCIMGFTAWWAYFTVNIMKEALSEPSSADVLQAAGATGLLGSLGTLLTLSWQFWFRRAKPSGAEGAK